jgi:uncharacterized phosphosugar-binding protein
MIKIVLLVPNSIDEQLHIYLIGSGDILNSNATLMEFNRESRYHKPRIGSTFVILVWRAQMNSLAQEYLFRTIEILRDLAASQKDQIDQAATLISESIGDGHRVYITRTSHTLDTEAYNRAGGFVAVHPLGPGLDFDQAAMPADLEDRLSHDEWKPETGDVVIVGTNVGIEVGTVEIAIACRRLGCKLIALTQVAFEQSPLAVNPHPAEKKLHEVADVVIDLGGEVGDGLLPLPSLDYKICPTSGVSGVAALWAIFAGAAEKLVGSGKLPLVYKSVDLEGGMEHFKQINMEYKSRGIGYRELQV